MRILGFDIFEVSTDPEEVEVEEEEEPAPKYDPIAGLGSVESTPVEVVPSQSLGFGSRPAEGVPGFDPWEDRAR